MFLSNVISIEDKEKLDESWEFSIISNSSKYKIDIYSCIGKTESYILRYRKDNRFICELDKQLNMIRNIEVPVSSVDLSVAMERLEAYNEEIAWLDEYFERFS